MLTPDLCPTISKPHTTRENLGEVGGDRPLGIVGSIIFSNAGEALKRVKNGERNAKQICGSLCFRDPKNRFIGGNRGGLWAIGLFCNFGDIVFIVSEWCWTGGKFSFYAIPPHPTTNPVWKAPYAHA